jgi:hypothetical protein
VSQHYQKLSRPLQEFVQTRHTDFPEDLYPHFAQPKQVAGISITNSGLLHIRLRDAPRQKKLALEPLDHSCADLYS